VFRLCAVARADHFACKFHTISHSP
jgi:hypothetical protein